MNRLKESFDEKLEDLKGSEVRVKQRVLNAVEQEQREKKRTVPKLVATAVALFVVVIAGFLATQFVKPQQQAALLNDAYYELQVFEVYELNNAFFTEAEAKLLTYNYYVQNLALIAYVKEHDLDIYEEQVEKHYESYKATVYEILEEQPNSWMHFHMQQLEEHFGVNLEQYLYLHREHVAKVNVAREMLLGLLHDEISSSDKNYEEVEGKAMAFYEEKYSAELAAFRERHNIDLNYEVKRQGQQAVLELDGQKYETVYVDGKEVFKDTRAVVDTFMFQFDNIRSEIEANEGLTLFCYATLENYKRGAEKLLSDKVYGLEAMRFIELLEVLKNSVEID